MELTIFHVLDPFPPVLLEHEGSEDPDEEEALEARMEERRRAWTMEHLGRANRAFQPLAERIREAGGATPSLKIVPSYLPEDLVALLKLETGSQDYDEVLVVHHPESWFKTFLSRTTADRMRDEVAAADLRIVDCSAKSGECRV